MAGFTAKDRASWQRLDLLGVWGRSCGASLGCRQGVGRETQRNMAADDKVVTLLAWVSGADVGRWLTDLEAGRCWYWKI